MTIDGQLAEAGWLVQSRNQMNLSAGLGGAVREFAMGSGPVDYTLLVSRTLRGLVEAKPEGMNLSGFSDQAARYMGCAQALVPVYQNVLITKYVRFWFEYFYLKLRQRAAGGVQPNLNLDIVSELVLPLPSEDELARIVSRLLEQFAGRDDVRELLGRDQVALCQSVLKAAFEGRLVPQDSADEPASALLAQLHNGGPNLGKHRRRAPPKYELSYPLLPGMTEAVDPGKAARTDDRTLPP